MFTPRDFVKYEETIRFDINGLHKIDVKVRGEGIPLKLELEKSEYANIEFGVAKVNGDITKVAKLAEPRQKSNHSYNGS